MKRRARLNPLAYAHMVRELELGASTDAELAEVSGMSERTVREFTTALYAVRAIHVGAWLDKPGHRAGLEVWKLGDGPDAVRKLNYSTQYDRARRFAAKHGCDRREALEILRSVGFDRRRAELVVSRNASRRTGARQTT